MASNPQDAEAIAAISKWICRIGLGIGAVISMLTLPLALFLGIMATDSGVRPSTVFPAFMIIAAPLVVAASCIGLIFLLERFKRLQPYAALLLMIVLLLFAPQLTNFLVGLTRFFTHLKSA